MVPRFIFVTGTDTGVGKTLLTGLLVSHLRRQGKHAIALKPFCSGGTADVEFLHVAQNGAVPREVINPFYYPEPIAPLVSQRLHRRRVRLPEVIDRIRKAGAGKEYILIEGSGGLLVPLGTGFDGRDLIRRLRCEVILVSRNRLGTINHTLLSLAALQKTACKSVTITLMAPRKTDLSAHSNLRLLREMCDSTPVFAVPYIGNQACNPECCDKNAKKLKKTLASILA
jgi:dethiobiotin synthetase